MRKSQVCDRIPVYVGDRVKKRWKHRYEETRIGTITDIYEKGIDVLWDCGLWVHHEYRYLIVVESFYNEFLEKIRDRIK